MCVCVCVCVCVCACVCVNNRPMYNNIHIIIVLHLLIQACIRHVSSSAGRQDTAWAVRALAVAHSCSGLRYPSRLFGRATIKYRSGSNHTDTAGLCSSVPRRASGEVSADEGRSARPRVRGGDGATLPRLGGGSRPSLRREIGARGS